MLSGFVLVIACPGYGKLMVLSPALAEVVGEGKVSQSWTLTMYM